MAISLSNSFIVIRMSKGTYGIASYRTMTGKMTWINNDSSRIGITNGMGRIGRRMKHDGSQIDIFNRRAALVGG
ncbi:hypothetical protein TIFTF001_015703 [Ficus carica]|uniref:Uncharacterized protein n=1 Tax=Ficus carica TaxID=3494 RepID=A0AA88AI74_FICCA|nr:hypothetical protein TIFTF001_015703 [Ficus carica]